MNSDKVKIVAAPSSILKLVKRTKVDLDAQDAIKHILDSYLVGVDTKEIRILKGRNEYRSIDGYLCEIPPRLIACVAKVLDEIAMGVSFTSILDGNGWRFINWIGHTYPILVHARMQAMRLRDGARAEKALDRLESIAEDGESDSARVKANEILLRATHSAFGHATETKTTSTRPLITINVGAIYGSNGSVGVENLGKLLNEDSQNADVIDVEAN